MWKHGIFERIFTLFLLSYSELNLFITHAFFNIWNFTAFPSKLHFYVHWNESKRNNSTILNWVSNFHEFPFNQTMIKHSSSYKMRSFALKVLLKLRKIFLCQFLMKPNHNCPYIRTTPKTLQRCKFHLKSERKLSPQKHSICLNVSFISGSSILSSVYLALCIC